MPKLNPPRRSFSFAATIAIAFIALAGIAAPSAAARRPLRIVYYHPADRPPLPGYRARLTAVMRNVQAFYANEMQRNGWAKRAFDLELDGDGLLNVHLAPGHLTLAQHKRGETDDEMMRQVDRALRAEGLEPGHETMVVFSNLLVWDGGVAKEIGPYWGGGGPNSGRCCAYDDLLLDPAKLASKEPGGYYGRPCSVGEFNSHYIGGIAHELGHALGLPHDGECAADRRALGSSLMGGGNHTYGRDLRGEGLGTFLTPTDAMVLARHPLFRAEGGTAGSGATAQCQTLQMSQHGSTLLAAGTVSGKPGVYGVVAYSDPEGGADYDAISAAVRVGADGRFRLELPDLHRGNWEFRLKACHDDGNVSELVNTPFVVSASGEADTTPIVGAVAWSPVSAALASNDQTAVRAGLRRIRDEFATNREMLRQCGIVEAWLKPSAPFAADSLPASEHRVAVSDLEFESATVGWGQPQRDRILHEGARMPFIQAGGTVYAKGLYAHAPSRYAFRLDGRWATLDTSVGVVPGAGTVVFVVRGDGRELYRSQTIRSGAAQHVTLDIKGVDRLELITEDAGDGRSGDWGVWADAYIVR